MSEIEVIANFDGSQTARAGAKLLNSWFSWIMEGNSDDTEEIEALFEEHGLSFDDYFIDRDTDIDWEEIPEARVVNGNQIVVTLDSKTGIDTIREMLVAMAGFDVMSGGEDD